MIRNILNIYGTKAIFLLVDIKLVQFISTMIYPIIMMLKTGYRAGQKHFLLRP